MANDLAALRLRWVLTGPPEAISKGTADILNIAPSEDHTAYLTELAIQSVPQDVVRHEMLIRSLCLIKDPAKSRAAHKAALAAIVRGTSPWDIPASADSALRVMSNLTRPDDVSACYESWAETRPDRLDKQTESLLIDAMQSAAAPALAAASVLLQSAPTYAIAEQAAARIGQALTDAGASDPVPQADRPVRWYSYPYTTGSDVLLLKTITEDALSQLAAAPFDAAKYDIVLRHFPESPEFAARLAILVTAANNIGGVLFISPEAAQKALRALVRHTAKSEYVRTVDPTRIPPSDLLTRRFIRPLSQLAALCSDHGTRDEWLASNNLSEGSVDGEVDMPRIVLQAACDLRKSQGRTAPMRWAVSPMDNPPPPYADAAIPVHNPSVMTAEMRLWCLHSQAPLTPYIAANLACGLGLSGLDLLELMPVGLLADMPTVRSVSFRPNEVDYLLDDIADAVGAHLPHTDIGHILKVTETFVDKSTEMSIAEFLDSHRSLFEK